MDTFYSTIILPDLSPFGVVCSTVKSVSQRQKLSLKTVMIPIAGIDYYSTNTKVKDNQLNLGFFVFQKCTYD